MNKIPHNKVIPRVSSLCLQDGVHLLCDGSSFQLSPAWQSRIRHSTQELSSLYGDLWCCSPQFPITIRPFSSMPADIPDVAMSHTVSEITCDSLFALSWSSHPNTPLKLLAVAIVLQTTKKNLPCLLQAADLQYLCDS